MLRRTIPWKRTVRNPGLGLRDKVYLPQTLGTLPMPALPCPWIILSRDTCVQWTCMWSGLEKNIERKKTCSDCVCLAPQFM